ncbi:MAB_1171c family putative transporter [Streptomyces sp. NPDC000983]|uniref:MAB_1171c family putative transporter n=1 Tax=Streptomyces sp. NPDC000983 TaxID=3154373 RepID=UPI00332A942C
MNPSDTHLLYLPPTALLIAGLALKIPAIIRSWKDPNTRATWFVLLFAAAVFISVTPANIHRINTLTGVPNFAAPWAYTLINAFCGACLTMIITWREEPSPCRTRLIAWAWTGYATVIAALWITFLMADVPDERVYDLDTHYATTPWMREHIVLYLLGYLTSTVVSAWMIWTWIPHVRGRWLKAGLICLQAGYAMGVAFVAAKALAIGARWAGTDWDSLNTQVAPPFALLGGTLVAAGFILPVAGPFLQKWAGEQILYWTLLPLARAIRRVAPSSARAKVGRLAPLDLRLMQRQQHIEDGLLRLAPYYDKSLYQQAYRAVADQQGDKAARSLAGAVALRAALDAYGRQRPQDDDGAPAHIGEEITDHLAPISRAMARPRRVELLLRYLPQAPCHVRPSVTAPRKPSADA